jgi:DNA-directed RNA polymerase subunit N (RpoN/RPB10)
MLYVTCPTCGYFLGQKTIEYEKKKDEICSDPKLTREERESQLTKLILSMKLPRYCCNMRMMTYKDLVQDILPVPKND